jgi:signal transduction histidine kinase
MSAHSLVRAFRARMAPLALLAGVVVTVLPPIATALVLITGDRVQVDERADRVASRLVALASRQPVIWRYNARKIVLAAETLDPVDSGGVWRVQLEDCSGGVWWSSGPPLDDQGAFNWRLASTVPVETSDGPIAWVRVELTESSSASLLVAIVALGSLLSGAFLGFALWRLPVLTVESQGAELAQSNQRLRAAREQVARQNLELAQRVEQATERIRALSERLLAAQQEERQRIARDLHDGLGQWLSALTMEVETGLRGGTIAPELANALKGTLQQTSGDLRTVLEGLAPASLADGLGAAVREMLERFELRSGILTSVSMSNLDALPASVQAGVLRVVQEALTNVWKHADAREISVRLVQDAGELTLVVADDGEGFDPSTPGRSSGLGHMRDRVHLLGGAFDCESTVGEGTVVRAVILLPSAGEPEEPKE